MGYDRTSIKVRAGRRIQGAARYLKGVDQLFRPFLPSADEPPPMIVILAPPRSGSTLAYQLLRSALQCCYLSNLWNILYTTPALGYFASSILCRDGVSSFHSKHGFVPGLCGESEGLRFWHYWSGQGLEERDASFVPPERLQELRKVLARICKDAGGPFLAGFLGHAFCIPTLREYFPGSLFIHLQRDLLSNARSLLDLSPKEWRSLRPKGYEAYRERPREEQVVEQLFAVHRRILEQKGSGDTIELHYESLCRDPIGTIRAIHQKCTAHFAERMPPQRTTGIPEAFSARLVNPNDEGSNQELDRLIRERIASLEEPERSFFSALHRP